MRIKFSNKAKTLWTSAFLSFAKLDLSREQGTLRGSFRN